MRIFRKLKTALTVLREYGIKEFFGLFRDNLRKLLNFFKRKTFKFNNMMTYGIVKTIQKESDGLKILYVTTEFEAYHSQTVRYRIHNLRQALRGFAHTRFETVGGVYSVDWADIVVLMRTTWTEDVDEIIQKADRLKIPVVFDIDDIIFSTDYVESYCAVLGDSSEKNLKLRYSEFEGFEKTFKLCRYATASTNYIVEIMERAGTCAFLIHNGLNQKQLDIAYKAKKNIQDARAIGYLSGTKTHDVDFKQALPAIERIVREFPDVVLRVVGYLDTSGFSAYLSERTQKACYMNWTRLMRYNAQNYINIAPLDAFNPFCHAKSELKYFEAAAVGVPTVASATDTYLRCIKNGENGMIARTDEEWYCVLKKLLEDRAFYDNLAKNAKSHSISNYSPQAVAVEALKAYSSIIAKYRGE